LKRCAATIGAFIAAIWLVELTSALFFHGTLKNLGILPRSIGGLLGIPLHPLLHLDAAHLWHNSLGILLLGGLVFLREETHFWVVTFLGTLVGGIGVWLVGRPDVHIGASGVIFAYFAYLLCAGWFERRIGGIMLSVVVFVIWGSLLFGLLPWQTGISWEGHMFGLLGGVLAALLIAWRRRRRM
jgi:membrane associated rhomboid family serine protease